MNKRQIERKISLIPESVLNNNIIDDAEYLFLLKKTEKIILATYILTDFIPESESIKATLKDNSYEVLDAVCRLITSRSERFNFIKQIKSLFIKLLTQYNLAYISGYISQMNASIIKDEIGNLIRVIDDFERELEDERLPDLKQNYFNVDSRNKRQYKAKKSVKDINKSGNEINNNVFYKKIKNEELQNTNTTTNIGSDRGSRILEIIKDKGEVSIKGISEVILDCSEKTIQRTLNKMIEDGLIVKSGERRWARYSLS
jgi:hypothetical protein